MLFFCLISILLAGRLIDWRVEKASAQVLFQPSCSSDEIEAVAWKRISGRAQQPVGPNTKIFHCVANTVGQSPDGQQIMRAHRPRVGGVQPQRGPHLDAVVVDIEYNGTIPLNPHETEDYEVPDGDTELEELDVEVSKNSR